MAGRQADGQPASQRSMHVTCMWTCVRPCVWGCGWTRVRAGMWVCIWTCVWRCVWTCLWTWTWIRVSMGMCMRMCTDVCVEAFMDMLVYVCAWRGVVGCQPARPAGRSASQPASQPSQPASPASRPASQPASQPGQPASQSESDRRPSSQVSTTTRACLNQTGAGYWLTPGDLVFRGQPSFVPQQTPFVSQEPENHSLV